MLRILIYQVPSRTFPMHVTPYMGSRIKIASPIISINRSPHIDKRAQEQFQFTMLKKPICIKAKSTTKNRIKALFSNFKDFFAPLRITITVTQNTRIQTTF